MSVSMLWAFPVHADVLTLSQTVQSATSTTVNAVQQIQGLTVGGAVTEIDGALYVQTFSASGVTHIRAQVQCWDSSARASASGVCLTNSGGNTWVTASSTILVTGQGQTFTFQTYTLTDRTSGDSDPLASHYMPVDASKYYVITAYDVTTSGTYTLRDAGILASVSNPCVSTCGALGAIYYKIYQAVPPSSVSSVSAFSTPTAFQTTSSTLVNFAFTYNNANTYDFSGVALTDTTVGQQIAFTERSITSSGAGSFSAPATLVSGHWYTTQPYIRDSGSGQFLYGPWVVLNVLGGFNNLNSNSPALNQVDDSNASSTLQNSIFGMFNVPQLLQTKFPFSFIFGLALNYESLTTTDATSSASSFPVVELDYGTLAGISTSTRNALPARVVLLSTTTVSTFLPDPIRNTFRLLAAASVWLSFAYALYYRLTSSLDNEA